METLEEERKTSKFLEAGSNNWNEKEENLHGMDRQGRMEKKIKTSGTIISENTYTKYINKK